ncbi:hypothetical protein [Citrobacter cronae]|uniref:hypothetical protein n=1 Tax=Citrobacter cronae TaxID=1748967 RepID=UPI0038910C1B
MSKIARYQGNVRAFASDAQGMERTVFGGTNQADDLTSQITASFLRGWGIVGASEHPSLEDFNAAMYAMSQFIAYQHQMGVPEWHAEQEYHIGSICTHNGESYQSLQNANIGSQPPSAKWTPVLTSKNGLANLGLDHFGYEPTTGETAIFNGNKNLRYFINNNNESGVASVDFGLLWGFDGGGKLTKGIIPVARLDGLSGSTGNSTTAVMSQKAVTDALPTVTQSTGASTTSVMSQKATTDAINAAKTTVVQSVGTSTTSVMSQNAVTSLVNDAASVGVNQLWHDVTAIRTVGTSYTNDKGRPIVIAMNVKNVPSGLYASNITVQGIQLTTGSNYSGEHRFISAIVPPGQTYVYNPLAPSNFILLELY